MVQRPRPHWVRHRDAAIFDHSQDLNDGNISVFEFLQRCSNLHVRNIMSEGDGGVFELIYLAGQEQQQPNQRMAPAIEEGEQRLLVLDERYLDEEDVADK